MKESFSEQESEEPAISKEEMSRLIRLPEYRNPFQVEVFNFL